MHAGPRLQSVVEVACPRRDPSFVEMWLVRGWVHQADGERGGGDAPFVQ